MIIVCKNAQYFEIKIVQSWTKVWGPTPIPPLQLLSGLINHA